MLSQPASSNLAVELSQLVLDAMPDPVLLVQHSSGTVLPMNAAGREWISLAKEVSDDIHFSDVFPELDLATLPISDTGFVLARVNRLGETGPREVMLKLLPLAADSAPAGEPPSIAMIVCALVSRPTERDSLPRDALDDSFHDSLTRLPNRRLFQRRLERAIQRGAQGNYHFALLFVDLDGFKRINDQWGHLEGDRLLSMAAHRMIEAVRPQDMVARRDGDEFTILLDDLIRPDDAVHIAQRIIQHLQSPLLMDVAAQVSLGASIGIAMGGEGTMTADELIAKADAAMYLAKKTGGGMLMVADNAARDDGAESQQFRRLPR